MLGLFIVSIVFQIVFSAYSIVEGNAKILKTPKIVGGYGINIVDAPYQVWIALRSRHETYYGDGRFCGGSVISQRAILSAAHCFYNVALNFPGENVSSLIVIVAGSASVREPDKYTKEYRVQEVIIHPAFNNISDNDIALAFLMGFIPWNWPQIKAVPLAERPPSVGEICLTSGWGYVNEASVPILSIERCRLAYPEMPTSQLCAGYSGAGSRPCYGDSGGPLICSNQLSGIVSYGKSCEAPKIPVVYTNVSYYIDWIRQVNSSFDYSLYSYTDASTGLINCNFEIICLTTLLILLE
ncbi:trypsin eta-like isoform X2 [Drosophila willistoni]|uniref:trypsin eta-like isoform X2 n=1 Tax=Drosophila willistoni TaxID=7260 RepID=UPI001F0808AD|nr:trypsin eta-like isoform X2 [Drosophila willistoni]